MTERVTEGKSSSFFSKITHSLAQNGVFHGAINSEPVHQVLKAGTSLAIMSLRDPLHPTRIKPANRVLLGELNALDRVSHLLLSGQDRNFETKMAGRIRKELQESIAAGADTNFTLKLKRTLELMGPKYLRTVILDFLFTNFVIGTQNEYHLAKQSRPFFHYLTMEVDSDCNAKPRCPGCFAAGNEGKLGFETLAKVTGEAKSLGARFTAIIGGEPLLEKKNLFKLFRKYPRMPFLVATNGILLDEAYAREIAGLGNVMTFINIPGLEPTTTRLRRNPDAWKAIEQAARNLQKYGAASGFTSTVFQNNFEDVSSPEFVQQMIDFGMMLGLYFGYTDPLGCSPRKELLLTPKMNAEFSRRIQEVSSHYPLFLVDTSGGRERLLGGCPAGRGALVHVRSNGNFVECPLGPNSGNDRNVKTQSLEKLLRDERTTLVRGEQPQCVRNPSFVKKVQALNLQKEEDAKV